MFIHETTNTTATHASLAMAIFFVLMGSFGSLLTMHYYVKPSSKKQTSASSPS